jgi:trehalose-phosphatase
LQEGFGLTVTEAMWKSKPVVGGNVGGIRLQLHNHQTGFLVDSPEGAALRMRELLRQPGKAGRMGRTAREFVAVNFLLTRHLREYDPDEFFDRLRRAPLSVLLLDYDGTLAPFQVDRERAVPYPEVSPLLHEISRCRRTRLVVVSGRAARSVAALLGREPTVEIFGSHGAERLDADGAYHPPNLPEVARKLLDEVYRWAAGQGLNRQTEQKPDGIAFHWRGLDHEAAENIRQAVHEQCRHWEEPGLFEVREFDGGLELRRPGITKGTVVKTVLEETNDEAVLAYLGDDQTDEDAFGALNGRGLSVLVRPEQRATRADWWLRPPEELVSFLRRWLESCR